MKTIIGLDEILFAVDDVAASAQFLTDYGLVPIDVTAQGGRFKAMDGTAIVLAHRDNSSLPPAINDHCLMRKTVMGVADQASLDEITGELRKDRDVRVLSDGSIESVDDSGFVIGFQLTVRQPVSEIGEVSNAPGSPIQRALNHRGVDPERGPIQPRTLSHIVYFVPDVEKAERFYVDRLDFRCTDRFTGAGPFLQPAGSPDHHTHFMIGAPAHMQGVEHFTFHFAGPNEIIQNGTRFVEKGYQAFWGPGRHIFGSNWFWYFNSPFFCNIEMDADMDLLDGAWQPRECSMSEDTSQAFLLKYRERWSPGAGTSPKGDYA
ncbi:VOC family protein [Gynuella sunshinyii]|uniref:Putative ring-cleavage extradiol dioxygenase n=1 Tax=Gynuella sunshinyii YC6258 TaxID=1445510 RepID=A0A0C5VZ49_9GAMM|nr:VOC family protein [Gynuella sunshinyii]AJQ95694.1 putative ring-cleavage extradiol dioxygenase [Gynuella sunshinyii YC6258]